MLDWALTSPDLGIIYLVRRQNFPKNEHFLGGHKY